MPSLSIIVPVYNKAKYLDDCIKSILGQTFADFELILVNDGSTDGSGVICEKYVNADKRVLLIDQKNAGVSSARNAGLSAATGTYTGFIDSDDTIDADMYETLFNNAIGHDADVSVCRMRLYNNGKVIAPVPDYTISLLNHKEALVKCLAGDLDRSANNKIYKTKIAKSVRFDGHMYEDVLYTAKIFIAANKTVVQNVSRYNYMVRDNSTSMSGFNLKYMETTAVSGAIVKMVGVNDKYALPYARRFDVVANISLLNLLLLSDKSKFQNEYDQVVKNLDAYKSFILNSALVKKKHQYAFALFNVSPQLYKFIMFLYCRITRSDVIQRT